MARPFTERTAWARDVAAPVRDFLNTESAAARLREKAQAELEAAR